MQLSNSNLQALAAIKPLSLMEFSLSEVKFKMSSPPVLEYIGVRRFFI